MYSNKYNGVHWCIFSSGKVASIYVISAALERKSQCKFDNLFY